MLNGNKVAEKEEVHKIDIRVKIRQLLESFEATESILTPEELADRVKSELEIVDEDLSNFTSLKQEMS